MSRDDLIAAFAGAAEAHPLIEALLLSGSLGRGEGDAWSDVDLIVVTAPQDHAKLVDEVRAWAEAVAPAVLWRQVHPPWPLFHAITADYVRYDITVAPRDRVTESADRVRPLADKAGVYAALPPVREPPPIVPRAVHELAEEFLRVLGLLPLALGRGEYVVGATGVGLLRQHLQALMILEQRPVTPPGALALKPVLPAADIAVLARLTESSATAEAVQSGSLACAEAFLPRARRLAADVGATWPQALEDAVRRRLLRDLGLRLPGG